MLIISYILTEIFLCYLSYVRINFLNNLSYTIILDVFNDTLRIILKRTIFRNIRNYQKKKNTEQIIKSCNH